MAGSSWYHAGALNRNAEMPENWTQSQSDAPSIEYKFNQAQNNQHSYPDVQHPSSRYTGHGIQHNGPQSYMSPIGQKRPNDRGNGYYDNSSNTCLPSPGNSMGFGVHAVPNNATHLQTNDASRTRTQAPTPPIKIIGNNYFCELCNIRFPIDPSSLLVHRNGKVHEIELLKKMEVLTVIERQCHCTRCNVSLGFRFQVAVMHYEKAHKGIFKKMVELKELTPVRVEMNMRGRGGGRGRGGFRGRGRGTMVSSATLSPAPAKIAIVNSASVDAQKGLPKGFKIMNNTYYCEICSMPLPIDVDLMQHCFGRNHEIKLLIAEGVISLHDNKCTCELCKKGLGFGFKAALKHVRGHHKDEYKKIQSSKELGSVQKFQDASDKSSQPPMKKCKIAPAGEISSPFFSNSTSTVSLPTTQLNTMSPRAADKEKELVTGSLASVKSGDGTLCAVRKTRWSDAEDHVPPGCSTDLEEKVAIKQECVTPTDIFIKQECITSSSNIFIKQEHEFSNKPDSGGHTKESSKSSPSLSKSSSCSLPLSSSRSSSKSSSRTSPQSPSKFSKISPHSPSRSSSNSSSRSSHSSSQSSKSSSTDTKRFHQQSSNDHQKFSGESVEKDRSCHDLNY